MKLLISVKFASDVWNGRFSINEQKLDHLFLTAMKYYIGWFTMEHLLVKVCGLCICNEQITRVCFIYIHVTPNFIFFSSVSFSVFLVNWNVLSQFANCDFWHVVAPLGVKETLQIFHVLLRNETFWKSLLLCFSFYQRLITSLHFILTRYHWYLNPEIVFLIQLFP